MLEANAPANNTSNNIVDKVSNAWSAKSAETKQNRPKSTIYIDLTDAEQQEINQFLSQLKISEDLNNPNPQYRTANFLMLYKKLTNSTLKEKENFIAGVMQTLKNPDAFDNQASLKKTFEQAFYRVSAVNLMNQPFVNQMSDYINSIKIDGDDEEEEINFY